MKIKILLLLLLLYACNRTVEHKLYYDSGQIKEVRTYLSKQDTTTYYSQRYYINGTMAEYGLIKNNHKEGLWQTWYSDEQIRWEGIYENGHFLYDSIVSIPVVILDEEILRAGEKTYFRVYSPTIAIEDLAIGCTNGIIQVADKKDMYDFTIIPQNKGVVKLYFFLYGETIGEQDFIAK